MNHAETHSHMADYLEGDLDLTRRALLDAHLDACDGCSQEFAEMRSTIGLLRGLESPEPPPFLVETVMRRIRDGEGRVRFPDRVREFVASLTRPQVVLPATALALGLMLVTGSIAPSAFSLLGFGKGVQSAPPVAQGRALPPERSLQVVRVPQMRVNGPPPIVGRAPRITITLPTRGSNGRTLVRTHSVPRTHSVSNGGAGSPVATQSITRWSPSLQKPGGGFSRDLLSPPVGNPIARASGAEMVTLSGSVLSTDATSAHATDAERAARRETELDRRLQYMMRRPLFFSAEFARYSIAEQEIWVRNLAWRARELGRGSEVIEGLRATNNRLALQLATAFAAELRWVNQAARAEMAVFSGVSDSSESSGR